MIACYKCGKLFPTNTGHCDMSKGNIKPIRTETDYEAALAHIDTLMDAEPGTLEGEELDVLTDLVELYEAKHVPIGSAGMTACSTTQRLTQ